MKKETKLAKQMKLDYFKNGVPFIVVYSDDNIKKRIFIK